MKSTSSVCVGLLMLFATTARAGEAMIWRPGEAGDWSDAAHWQDGKLPRDGDDVVTRPTQLSTWADNEIIECWRPVGDRSNGAMSRVPNTPIAASDWFREESSTPPRNNAGLVHCRRWWRPGRARTEDSSPWSSCDFPQAWRLRESTLRNASSIHNRCADRSPSTDGEDVVARTAISGTLTIPVSPEPSDVFAKSAISF